MKTVLSLLMVMVLSQTIFAQGYRVNRTNEKKVNVRNLDYGKNIFSFSPVQILLTNMDQSNPDVAVGFSYERIFNNEHIGLKLPFSFRLNTDNNNNYYGNLNNNDGPYLYFMPTIKLYPLGQGPVKYAVGPQLLFAYGQDSYYSEIYNSTTGQYNTQLMTGDRTQFGFLINNSVNFTVVKNLYIGLDAGLGLVYYDNMPQASNNYYYSSYYPTNTYRRNNSVSPSFQLNFNMGFRF